MNIKISSFNSIGELIEAASRAEPNEMLRSHELSSRERGNTNWSGTASFEDALELHLRGWPEGRRIIENYNKQYGEIWNKFFPKQDFTQETNVAETGDIPVIENYIMGLPEAMMEFRPDNEKENTIGGSKLQRIILNGGASNFIRIESILMYGALIGALVNSMESAGFNVELNMVWCVSDRHFLAKNSLSNETGHLLKYVVSLKRFQDFLSLEMLAFAVAHSSMLRRLIFALIEAEPDKYIRSIQKHNYGYPVNLTDEDIVKFGVRAGDIEKHGNMYFRLLDSNYSLDQLVAQCTAVVKQHFTEVNFNKE